MKKVLKILMLENNIKDVAIIQHLLLKEKLNCEFNLTINKETYLSALDQFHPDIILSANSLPQFNSLDALAIARQRFPEVPFIMVTGTVSEEFAADIIKSGADDYILKDRMAKLPTAIISAIQRRKSEKEKQEAAEKLKQSEENYRTLVDQAFDSIITYTPDFIILDCNRKASGTLGYSRQELIGHKITEFFFKEDTIARPLYLETLKAGQHILDYRRVKRKDGSDIEMEIGTKMMPDGNLMAIVRDITERKKAEQKIIQSETNLRTIFENTSEGFLLMDKNAVVIAFNSKATVYTFFSDVKELQIGRSIYDFIEESRRSFFREIIAKVLNRESIQYDRSYEMKNGATVWIDFSATPVIESGQVKGICITGRDITGKKLMEKEILEQKVQQQKKIARAIIKAEEKERSRLGRELHDNINQILAGTKSYLGMTGSDKKMKELIKYPMELIDNAIQEIRLISNKNVTPQKNINLKELIQRLLDDLDKNTTIKTTLVCNLTDQLISVDLKLNIYRIIQEQLNNVLKHADAKNVSVTVQTDNSILSIVVTDDGKGFDVNKKRKGIGISNMMNRIESFNGVVVIESSPGKGCRIEINTPY